MKSQFLNKRLLAAMLLPRRLLRPSTRSERLHSSVITAESGLPYRLHDSDNYPTGSTLTVGHKTYILRQLHFHHPSEEHVNGRGYDMVAHLVHSDAKGRLAVVAILFDKGEANAFPDSI